MKYYSLEKIIQPTIGIFTHLGDATMRDLQLLKKRLKKNPIIYTLQCSYFRKNDFMKHISVLYLIGVLIILMLMFCGLQS